MHEHGLGEIVRSGLVAAGCDPSLIHELDDHGTIQIDLNGCPNMYVARDEEQVVVWSDLCDFHDSIIRHQSEPLLRMVMDGYPYGSNGQLVLRERDGRLQLMAILAGHCLQDAQGVAGALDAFYKSLVHTVEIIRQ